METFRRQTPFEDERQERQNANWAIWILGMVLIALVFLGIVLISLTQNGVFGGPHI